MTIHKAFARYGKRFFILPAAVTPVIACCGRLPPQLLWGAHFIVQKRSHFFREACRAGPPVYKTGDRMTRQTQRATKPKFFVT